MSLHNSKPDVTRLKILSEEYRQIVQLMRDTSMIETSAEVDALGAERALLHDEIIAEFARLGYPVTNRKEARERAFNLVSWLHDVGLEGEKDSFAAASSSGAETTKLFTIFSVCAVAPLSNRSITTTLLPVHAERSPLMVAVSIFVVLAKLPISLTCHKSRKMEHLCKQATNKPNRKRKDNPGERTKDRRVLQLSRY